MLQTVFASPVAYDLDFRTREAIGAYDPEKEEACVNLVIVNSIGVELTESLVADITLTDPSPVIEISEAMSFTIIQILDDDRMSKADMMCFLTQ